MRAQHVATPVTRLELTAILKSTDAVQRSTLLIEDFARAGNFFRVDQAQFMVMQRGRDNDILRFVVDIPGRFSAKVVSARLALFKSLLEFHDIEASIYATYTLPSGGVRILESPE
jgi:hypothetical protein